MRRFGVLATLALLTILEVGAWLAIGQRIGLAGALAVVIAQAIAGVAVMRWAARGDAVDRGWRIAGGALIAFPGLLLGLVGVALIVPTTRALIKEAMTRKAEEAIRRSGMSVVTVTGADGGLVTTLVEGDVISGEVIKGGSAARAGGQNQTDRTGTSSDASPSGPQIIRGELQPKDRPS